MNYYFVVEGKQSERKVYPPWLSQLNSDLVQIRNTSEFNSNNYYIVSGGGYPNYINIINKGIEDFNTNSKIDKFVVCCYSPAVDSTT